jgi:hypothetical protein
MTNHHKNNVTVNGTCHSMTYCIWHNGDVCMLLWSYKDDDNNNNTKKFQRVPNIGKYNSNTTWLKMMAFSYMQENATCSLSHCYAT